MSTPSSVLAKYASPLMEIGRSDSSDARRAPLPTLMVEVLFVLNVILVNSLSGSITSTCCTTLELLAIERARFRAFSLTFSKWAVVGKSGTWLTFLARLPLAA